MHVCVVVGGLTTIAFFTQLMPIYGPNLLYIYRLNYLFGTFCYTCFFNQVFILIFFVIRYE